MVNQAEPPACRASSHACGRGTPVCPVCPHTLLSTPSPCPSSGDHQGEHRGGVQRAGARGGARRGGVAQGGGLQGWRLPGGCLVARLAVPSWPSSCTEAGTQARPQRPRAHRGSPTAPNPAPPVPQVITRVASTRVAEFAFKFAAEHGRQKVRTAAHPQLLPTSSCRAPWGQEPKGLPALRSSPPAAAALGMLPGPAAPGCPGCAVARAPHSASLPPLPPLHSPRCRRCTRPTS